MPTIAIGEHDGSGKKSQRHHKKGVKSKKGSKQKGSAEKSEASYSKAEGRAWIEDGRDGKKPVITPSMEADLREINEILERSDSTGITKKRSGIFRTRSRSRSQSRGKAREGKRNRSVSIGRKGKKQEITPSVRDLREFLCSIPVGRNDRVAPMDNAVCNEELQKAVDDIMDIITMAESRGKKPEFKPAQNIDKAVDTLHSFIDSEDGSKYVSGATTPLRRALNDIKDSSGPSEATAPVHGEEAASPAHSDHTKDSPRAIFKDGQKKTKTDKKASRKMKSHISVVTDSNEEEIVSVEDPISTASSPRRSLKALLLSPSGRSGKKSPRWRKDDAGGAGRIGYYDRDGEFVHKEALEVVATSLAFSGMTLKESRAHKLLGKIVRSFFRLMIKIVVFSLACAILIPVTQILYTKLRLPISLEIDVISTKTATCLSGTREVSSCGKDDYWTATKKTWYPSGWEIKNREQCLIMAPSKVRLALRGFSSCHSR